MILGYFGVAAPQCDQANKRFGLTQCCDATGTLPASPLDSKCDDGAFPEFQKYGYGARATNNKELEWPDIRNHIYCRQQPFAFSWYDLGGGHMMVGVGYEAEGTSRFVCRNDPEPVDYDCIPYDYYVNGTGSHWNDYYDFVPIK
jgi:hypothetical protein